MIGGGLRYIMSAWAAVHLLRNTGCRLPIEMWYPLAEAPSEGAKQAFAELGVVTRLLDLPGLNISRPFSKEAESSGNMGRFTIKVAALILSRFQEVGWWASCSWFIC
jgi:alpha 1,2-mannosyltransferase